MGKENLNWLVISNVRIKSNSLILIDQPGCLRSFSHLLKAKVFRFSLSVSFGDSNGK